MNIRNCLCGAAALLAIISHTAMGGGEALPDDAEPLSTDQIRSAFDNVKDEAEVQDAAGTRAVNHWYSDGTFTNNWRNAGASGEVTGRWWAEDNKRCVMVTSGLPERQGLARCSPVYRLGEVYFSTEQDGSVHGVHRLAPLD